MRGKTKSETGIRSVITILVALSLLGSLAAPSVAYVRPGVTEMVSVTSDGAPRRHNRLLNPTISETGRYVVYGEGGNLVGVERAASYLTYLYDRRHRRAGVVSVSSAGEHALTLPTYNDPALFAGHSADVSANGRFVTFHSPAHNLVPGDTNVCSLGYTLSTPGPCLDVFVHDRREGTTVRVSVASDGTEADDASLRPSISADGRYVAFQSQASNLVADAPSGPGGVPLNVYVHDLSTSETRLVSIASEKVTGGFGFAPMISGGGRYVAYVGRVDEGDAPMTLPVQVVVRDLRRGEVELVSVASDGTPAQRWSGPGGPGVGGPSISANGRYISFGSVANNLVPNTRISGCTGVQGTVSGCFNVFVRDRKTGRTTRASVTSVGDQPNDHSGSTWLNISGDGRFVAFISIADNLYPGDPGPCGDFQGDPVLFSAPYDHAYVHDMRTGTTDLASIDVSGKPGVNSTSCAPGPQNQGVSLSKTGRYIAFGSYANDLVEDDERPQGQLAERTMQQQNYVRDQGPVLGGDLGGRPPDEDADPEPIICIAGQCIPPMGWVSFDDVVDDVDAAVTERGGNLIGGAIAYRPLLGDLYVVLELESMPRTPVLAAATAGMVYGMSFAVDGAPYEIRSASSGLGPYGETTADFGLFSCTDAELLCTKIADLKGGFGTTGERITFSIPLSDLGIEDGSVISEVKLFTALGSFLGGPAKVLDVAKLK